MVIGNVYSSRGVVEGTLYTIKIHDREPTPRKRRHYLSLSLPALSLTLTEKIHTATPSLTQNIQSTGSVIPDPRVLRVRCSK